MYKSCNRYLLTAAVFLAAAMITAPLAEATAIRGNAGFNTGSLAANDDGSTGLQSLGFTANFFGNTHSSAFINNNGNITFGGPLSTFTPFDLTSTGTEIIAPFFADVDTRGTGTVKFGQDTVGGHSAFGVNWDAVGFYNANTSPTNTFQLVLIDRSDIALGDFDIEFNYSQILWETGQASGGSASGLGGSSARAGFSNGTGSAGSFFELAGSAVNGAFLDGGPATTSLINNSLNSTVSGRYLFSARNGTIITAPEPGTVALLALGLLGLGAARRRGGKSV